MSKRMMRYLFIEAAVAGGLVLAFLADVWMEVMILPLLTLLWIVLLSVRQHGGRKK